MFSKLQFLDALKNPMQKIKASIKQTILPEKVTITQVIQNKLYYISPLSQQNIDSLLQELKKNHQFQIWNFGEYSYSEKILTKLLDGRQRNSDGKQIVYNLTYEYFANIPFCQMIKSVQSIEAFLSLSEKNLVYIHCQDNKRRSAVFLASYIFLTGIETDIVSSILKVNQILNISIQGKEITQGSSLSTAIYKSQHLVLKNLMNYINNSSFINKNAWILKKILINNPPKIHLVLKLENPANQKVSAIKFKVLLEIRSALGIIYKKIFQNQFIEGESLCLRIPQTEPLVLKDDFLIIVKYVYEKKGYSILRTQLNTNFIYDPYFRVRRNDMDLSVNNANRQNETLFMDLLLEQNLKELSDLSQLNILKQNIENQQIHQAHQAQKNETLKEGLEPERYKENVKQEEEEDGFGILDEEQEAEHNQKMQKEIEEELARQLQNIRKKRNQQGNKSQQYTETREVEIKNKQILPKINTQSGNDKQKYQMILAEDSLQNQIPENTKTSQPKHEKPTSVQPSAQLETSEQYQAPENNQEAQQSQNQEASQDESSSSSEESSSEQPQQQDDLDDYLTKLQSQAQKNS